MMAAILLVGCTAKKEASLPEEPLNYIDYSESQELPLDLHSDAYLLIRLNDMKVLYSKNSSQKFFPASLAKIVTMGTALNLIGDREMTSSVSYDQLYDLIAKNASIAYLDPLHKYSVIDLLNGLILPSGADAAQALINMLDENDFIYEMNQYADSLELTNSNFTNATGLHSDELYTTLDDYLKIVVDTLRYQDAREVLHNLSFTLSDGKTVKSTLAPIKTDKVEIVGGKTGYTGEAGQNLAVFYEVNGRSYLLITAGADGDPGRGQSFHFDDAKAIFNYLY